MKNLLKILIPCLALFSAAQVEASEIGNSRFEKVIYLSAAVTSTQSALNSGLNYGSAKGFFDGDLWAIPAGAVIENIYVICDTILAGPSLFELGDDDDANDFIASASSPLAATGILYWSVQYKGDYLKNVNSLLGPNAKYYAAAGKELKLNVTGTATAGKARVVVKGYIASQFN